MHTTTFEPGARPVLVMLPAMGVAAAFYTPFVHALEQACGATVLMIELPGQGASALRASSDDFGYREVVETFVPEAVQRAVAQHPGRPVILVGHSLGGQLALLAAAGLTHTVHGLVLIAAGTAHWRAWPQASRWRAALAVHAIRLVASVLPWYPGARLGFGGNQPRRFMRDWSFNACRGGYCLEGSARSSAALARALADVRLPVHALSLRDDPIAPPGAVAELLAKVPNADVTHDAFDGVTSDAPWRRHFSWARQSTGVAQRVARWLARAAPSVRDLSGAGNVLNLREPVSRCLPARRLGSACELRNDESQTPAGDEEHRRYTAPGGVRGRCRVRDSAGASRIMGDPWRCPEKALCRATAKVSNVPKSGEAVVHNTAWVNARKQQNPKMKSPAEAGPCGVALRSRFLPPNESESG
jgi:predicted alpha/beta hydrolase